MAKIKIPIQLMLHASIPQGVVLEVKATSLSEIYDELEASFPQLRGTLRDPITRTRRAYIRIFAQREDLSDFDPESTLPSEIILGDAVIHFVTAISGG